MKPRPLNVGILRAFPRMPPAASLVAHASVRRFVLRSFMISTLRAASRSGSAVGYVSRGHLG
jgi:hypothetical protein